MAVVYNKLIGSGNYEILKKSTAVEIFPYAAASCTSFSNDESWIKPFGYHLLSPQNINLLNSKYKTSIKDKCLFDPNKGLKISLIEGEKEVIIAFGAMGSGATETDDRTNKAVSLIQTGTAAMNLTGFTCNVYEFAAELVDKISKLETLSNKKITLVGQSLGGSIAQYVGVKNKLTSYSFNPMPLGRAQVQKLKEDKTASDKDIYVISTEGDYATALAENKISQLARWVIQTPELFGKKFRIPSAYSDSIENHVYFMGSLMKYLGYDIRAKTNSIPTYELLIHSSLEIHSNLAIKEIKNIAKKLNELKQALQNRAKDAATDVLKSLQIDYPWMFGSLCFVAWLANEKRDLGDYKYGEKRLLNTPLILNNINVEGIPLVDSLIEHFNTLVLLKSTKNALVQIAEQTKQLSQELLQLPLVSDLEKHLKSLLLTEAQKNVPLLDDNAIKLMKSLRETLIDSNASFESQKKALAEIAENYPALYLAILNIFGKRFNAKLQIPDIEKLLRVKPTLLLETFKCTNDSLITLIESMELLKKMQEAVHGLSCLKSAFQFFFKQLSEVDRKKIEMSSPSEYKDIIEQIDELQVFFTLENMQKRLLDGYSKNHQGLQVSSKQAITPGRLVQLLPEDNRDNPHLKRIYMVCSECVGIIKVGGLAEAVRGIADGLISKGHQVTLIMPKYDAFPNDKSGKVQESLKPTSHEVKHCYGGIAKTDHVFSSKINDIEVLFIGETDPIQGRDILNLFSLARNSLYEIPGDIDEVKVKERFSYFGSAAAELIRQLKEQIDVVFFHDWHGAMGIPQLARNHPDEWVDGSIPPMIYVFHNNGYAAQGMLNDQKHASILKNLNLPIQYFNIAKESLSIADHICTVSESYALEVQSREGNGLQAQMREIAMRGKFTGITNGCNLSFWDPYTETQLVNWVDPETGEKTPIHFGIASNLLENKKLIKMQLQKWLLKYHPATQEKYDIDVTKENVILFVGRFDASQKGIDKLRLAMHVAKEKQACLIVMGCKENSAEAFQILDQLEKEAQDLKDPKLWGGAWIIRDSFNKRGLLNYQQGTEDGVPGIGHLVRAAANINFCPSEYEPCGLTHLEGFPYGQITVATDCGGFADIICQEIDDPNFNGFLFPRFDDWKGKEQEQALIDTMNRACDYLDRLENTNKNALMQKLIETSKKYSWTMSPQGLSPIEKYEAVINAASLASKERGATESISPVFLTRDSSDSPMRLANELITKTADKQ